jgi:glycine oxidase
VIGAGIIGCAVAFELARRGLSVHVVDARAAGQGATQASAGVLAPLIEGRPDDPLRALGLRSLAMYERFVEDVSAAADASIEFNRSGTLEVAFTREWLDQLTSGAGAAAAVLDRDDVLRRVPGIVEDVVGGVFIAQHAFVGAEALTGALARAAAKAGATFTTGAAVTAVRFDTDAVVVDVGEGDGSTRLAGDLLILAAGSWSGQLGLPVPVQPPVRPVRGQLLRLHWPDAPLPHILWSERCYLVPWRDGTLLVGATSEEVGFDERSTVAGVRDLLDAVSDLLPRAWQARFDGVRVGLRPASPDSIPLVGRSSADPRLIYATGHYRNGILLAPLTAYVVADLITRNLVDDALGVMAPARLGL